LSPFSDAELEKAGLAEEVIVALRRVPPEIVPDETLAELEAPPELAAMVAELWERPGHWLDRIAAGEPIGPELVGMDEDEAASRLEEESSASSVLRISDTDAFAAVLERPIEDWMVYLHPAQRRPVTLSRDGPVRVRGGAGTGKTVVALHRARHLADLGGGMVLLTTFVTTLPRVWQGLFATFAPDVRERIDMRTVDALAYEIYRSGGGHAVPAENAWLRTVVNGLHAKGADRIGGLTSLALQEEFDYVLTGRGLESRTDYLALPRSGRGSPLAAPARKAVWDLYERYRERLDDEGRVGFPEIRRDALDMLRSGTVHRRYAAVVADEAQDLTESAVRLLAAVAGGGRAPRLTLVGDGQQAIYPGGFSLRSVGVDVRGRSAVLRTNWRNTYAIWLAASAFIAGETFDDLEDEDQTLRDDTDAPYPLRDGTSPRLHEVGGTQRDALDWLAELIAEDLHAGVDPGDCVALAPTIRLVRELESALKRRGLPVSRLERYDGSHEAAVWLGTFHRAKGLEFKRVYVGGLEAESWPPRIPGLDEHAQAEARERAVRAAFVAFTRARDRLEVVVASRPAEPLASAAWAFDR